MHANNNLSTFIIDWICISGCALIALVPFINRRHREPWAARLFAATGLLGILSYGFDFIVNIHHFGFSSSTGHMLWRIHLLINGILVGWLTILFFSGQMKRKA